MKKRLRRAWFEIKIAFFTVFLLWAMMQCNRILGQNVILSTGAQEMELKGEGK